MIDVNVFTYGTLMIPEVMETVTGHSFRFSKARLQHYQRFQIQKKIYPAIVYRQMEYTDGIVYHNVDDESLKRLDYFEDTIYYRKEVPVVSNKGNEMTAYAYIINTEYERSLSNNAWDLESFRERCLEQYVKRADHWMQNYSS